MMRWMFVLLVVAAGCDSLKNVPCDQCSKYGAVCDPRTKMCVKGLVLDMAMSMGGGGDMADAAAAGDMATVDLMPMCTQSAVATDCTDASKPICGGDNTCRACNSSTDDAVCQMRSQSTPRCQLSGTNAGQCVQCRSNTDCGGTTPICGSDGACRGCAAHSECPSLGMWTRTGTNTAIPGICVMDGTSKGACVTDQTKIFYVDNGGQSITTCNTNHMNNDGTLAKPYCDIQDALNGGSHAYIVVAGRGSTFSYGSANSGQNVTVMREVTLLWPGKAATTKAVISAGASAAPCVSVTGAIPVVIDGFDIALASGGVGSVGLSCSGGATVVARNNNIRSADGGGVVSSACTLLTLDGNDIHDNAGGGINLTTTKFALTNNAIAANNGGANVYGVKLNDSPAGSIFAFNTVANNHSDTSTPAGVYCAAATTLLDSIVAANTSVSGTQFGGGSCTLTNVVTGASDTLAGAITSPPAFTSTYRLDLSNATNKTKNETCCIDKLAAPGTANADHDVDFTARPKGTSATPYDIGAQEAE